MHHTGTAGLYHGVPGEMAEEIAVQLAPTYDEDWAKQVEELGNPSFYIDVALQTLLMKAGFTGVGAAKHGVSMFDKNYRAKDREARNLKDKVRD